MRAYSWYSRRPLCTGVLALAIAISLSGCSAFRPLMPGGVTAADAEWVGSKGDVKSIASMIDPKAGAVAILLQTAGQGDPLGVVMSLTVIRSGPAQADQVAEVRQVVCVGKWAVKCQSFPPGSRVKFAGSPIGPLWWPTRMTASDFND